MSTTNEEKLPPGNEQSNPLESTPPEQMGVSAAGDGFLPILKAAPIPTGIAKARAGFLPPKISLDKSATEHDAPISAEKRKLGWYKALVCQVKRKNTDIEVANGGTASIPFSLTGYPSAKRSKMHSEDSPGESLSRITLPTTPPGKNENAREPLVIDLTQEEEDKSSMDSSRKPPPLDSKPSFKTNTLTSEAKMNGGKTSEQASDEPRWWKNINLVPKKIFPRKEKSASTLLAAPKPSDGQRKIYHFALDWHRPEGKHIPDRSTIAGHATPAPIVDGGDGDGGRGDTNNQIVLLRDTLRMSNIHGTSQSEAAKPSVPAKMPATVAFGIGEKEAIDLPHALAKPHCMPEAESVAYQNIRQPLFPLRPSESFGEASIIRHNLQENTRDPELSVEGTVTHTIKQVEITTEKKCGDNHSTPVGRHQKSTQGFPEGEKINASIRRICIEETAVPARSVRPEDEAEDSKTTDVIETNLSEDVPVISHNSDDYTMISNPGPRAENVTQQSSELNSESHALTLMQQDDQKNVGNDKVTFAMIGVPTILLTCLFVILRLLHLPTVSNAILVEFVRGTFQIVLVGTLFSFLMRSGESHLISTITYILMAIALASYEITMRTKYTYNDQFYHAFASVSINVFWIGSIAVHLVAEGEQRWCPKTVLPITCLLIASCINGVSLGLDFVHISIVEEEAEFQLLRAFGRSNYEALYRFWTSALQKGISVALSSMHTMGACGIAPLLMSGQILAGSSAKQATVNQILLTVMMTVCTFCSVAMSSIATLLSSFGPEETLQVDHFVRNRKLSLLGRLWILGSSFIFGSNDSNVSMSTPHFVPLQSPTPLVVFPTDFRVIVKSPTEEASPVLLEISSLSFDEYLCQDDVDVEVSDNTSVCEVSFSVLSGEVVTIEGAPAPMISDIFSAVAGFRHFHNGEIRFAGKTLDESDLSQWRRDVLALPPGKPELSGTPLQFLKRISSYRKQKMDDLSDQERFSNTLDRLSDILFQWELHLDCLGKDWKNLSMEEGYLVLLASALASQPKVLLVDGMELLSPFTKWIVEDTFQKFTEKTKGGIIVMRENGSLDAWDYSSFLSRWG